MLLKTFTTILVLIIAVAFPGPAFCQSGDTTSVTATDDIIRDTMVIRHPSRRNLTAAEIEDLGLVHKFNLCLGYQVVSIPTTRAADEAMQTLNDQGFYAVFDRGYQFADTPNDPYFAATNTYKGQWNLQRIGMENAWSQAKGNQRIIIGIVDSGVDFTHEDFRGLNFWSNSLEIPDNGIDDDGNGFVDDVRGWDFVEGDNDPSPFWYAPKAHGTKVMGILGADTNNGIGMSGIAGPWHGNSNGCKFMVTRTNTAMTNIYAAILYCAQMGANVITVSLGGAIETWAEECIETIVSNSDTMIVAASGNFAVEMIDYPAALPGVIAVGATDRDDRWHGNYAQGPEQEITAPFDMLSSTIMGGISEDFDTHVEYWEDEGLAYDPDYWPRFRGTSSSTPQVTAVAGLMLSRKAPLTPDQIRQILRDTAVKAHPEEFNYDASGHSNKMGYGRLDAKAAVDAANNYDDPFLDFSVPANQSVFYHGQEVPWRLWTNLGNSPGISGGKLKSLDGKSYDINLGSDNQRFTVPNTIPPGRYRLAGSSRTIPTFYSNGSFAISSGKELKITEAFLDKNKTIPHMPVFLSFQVQNQACMGITQDARSVTINYFLSTSPNPEDEKTPIGTPRTIGVISRNGSITFSDEQLDLPVDTPQGSYFVHVQVDADNTVLECDEGNNVATLPLEVTDVCTYGDFNQNGAVDVTDLMTLLNLTGQTVTPQNLQYDVSLLDAAFPQRRLTLVDFQTMIPCWGNWPAQESSVDLSSIGLRTNGDTTELFLQALENAVLVYTFVLENPGKQIAFEQFQVLDPFERGTIHLYDAPPWYQPAKGWGQRPVFSHAFLNSGSSQDMAVFSEAPLLQFQARGPWNTPGEAHVPQHAGFRLKPVSPGKTPHDPVIGVLIVYKDGSSATLFMELEN